MISMDFAGDQTEGSIQPRLRQAYVTWVGPWSNISFTAGQAWTTYLDLGVWPELFDLEGPNAMTGTRQGLVRGSYAFGKDKNLIFDVALEQPETAVANGNGLRDLPDLVARLNWQKDWGHLQAAAIGRQLVAESTAGTGRDSAFGWGLSFSGNWLVPGTKRKHAPSDDLGARQDNIQFQIQGGSGTGRYVFDPGAAPTPQDAVYDDATAELNSPGRVWRLRGLPPLVDRQVAFRVRLRVGQDGQPHDPAVYRAREHDVRRGESAVPTLPPDGRRPRVLLGRTHQQGRSERSCEPSVDRRELRLLTWKEQGKTCHDAHRTRRRTR